MQADALPITAHLHHRRHGVLRRQLHRLLLIFFLDNAAVRHVPRQRILQPHHACNVRRRRQRRRRRQ